MKNNDLFNELIKKQLKTIPTDKKMKYNDLKRLCKYLSTSIFDEKVCSIWTGYITNINNISKGIYINFYFKSHKVALHRLLYINFVGNLNDDEYLKYTCENKGKCCNLAHLSKFKYSKTHKKKQTKLINEDNKNNINNKNENENKLQGKLKLNQKHRENNNLSFTINFN